MENKKKRKVTDVKINKEESKKIKINFDNYGKKERFTPFRKSTEGGKFVPYRGRGNLEVCYILTDKARKKLSQFLRISNKKDYDIYFENLDNSDTISKMDHRDKMEELKSGFTNSTVYLNLGNAGENKMLVIEEGGFGDYKVWKKENLYDSKKPVAITIVFPGHVEILIYDQGVFHYFPTGKCDNPMYTGLYLSLTGMVRDLLGFEDPNVIPHCPPQHIQEGTDYPEYGINKFEDKYCQTWIYYFAWSYAVNKCDPEATVRWLSYIKPRERLDLIEEFWKSLLNDENIKMITNIPHCVPFGRRLKISESWEHVNSKGDTVYFELDENIFDGFTVERMPGFVEDTLYYDKISNGPIILNLDHLNEDHLNEVYILANETTAIRLRDRGFSKKLKPVVNSLWIKTPENFICHLFSDAQLTYYDLINAIFIIYQTSSRKLLEGQEFYQGLVYSKSGVFTIATMGDRKLQLEYFE